MSTISNRFYVTALEDGTTLHGNLTSDKSLSQAWNGTTAVPNWTTQAEQPTIWLTLLSGNDYVAPSQTFSWYYNGTEITFDSTTNISTAPLSGVFQKTTHTITSGNQSVTMPALKIIGNLAGSSNVDIDMIRFSGNYVINGTGIAFSAEIQVKITSITAGSNLGVINFVNGISDITEQGQQITMYGVLYDSDGAPSSETYTTRWYLNDSVTPTSGTNISVTEAGNTRTYTNAFQVSESDITDHAIITCQFYIGNELKYVAYAAVDDMQDPEFMYIQYGTTSPEQTNNGNAASLRKNETAYFKVWVGSRDNAAIRTGWTSAVYKLQLLDGEGSVITDSSLSGIPNPDSGDTTNYYRTLTKGSDNKASFYIPYTVVEAKHKSVTGIIIATV